MGPAAGWPLRAYYTNFVDFDGICPLALRPLTEAVSFHSSCAKLGPKMSKIVRNGSRKMISGSREVRKGQNCAADPLEALPDPKTAIKISKMNKNVENLENGGISVFFLLPGVVPIAAISAVWGHPLWSSLFTFVFAIPAAQHSDL